MTEETTTEITPEPPTLLNQEQKDFQKIQQDYINAVGQAGEAQYIISVKRKELAKLNRRIRILNKKASAMVEAEKARQAAKPNLSVVPDALTVSETPQATA